mgnify:CR=1 FL=1
MHDQRALRSSASDELRTITKEYFGYYDDLPTSAFVEEYRAFHAEAVKRGLIAPVPDGMVCTPSGTALWNLGEYAFIDGELATTTWLAGAGSLPSCASKSANATLTEPRAPRLIRFKRCSGELAKSP